MKNRASPQRYFVGVVPRLVVTRDGNQLSGKCPYCGKTHYHGAAGHTGPDHGHRVAHCADPHREIAGLGYTLHEA